MDRRAQGVAAYARQFHVSEDDAVTRLQEIVGPRMAEEAIHAAGGIWGPEYPLSYRERSLVVVAAIAAQGGASDRLAGHLRWGLDHGLTVQELEAALTMLGVYAGYPRASTAMEALQALIRESPTDVETP